MDDSDILAGTDWLGSCFSGPVVQRICRVEGCSLMGLSFEVANSSGGDNPAHLFRARYQDAPFYIMFLKLIFIVDLLYLLLLL